MYVVENGRPFHWAASCHGFVVIGNASQLAEICYVLRRVSCFMVSGEMAVRSLSAGSFAARPLRPGGPTSFRREPLAPRGRRVIGNVTITFAKLYKTFRNAISLNVKIPRADKKRKERAKIVPFLAAFTRPMASGPVACVGLSDYAALKCHVYLSFMWLKKSFAKVTLFYAKSVRLRNSPRQRAKSPHVNSPFPIPHPPLKNLPH